MNSVFTLLITDKNTHTGCALSMQNKLRLYSSQRIPVVNPNSFFCLFVFLRNTQRRMYLCDSHLTTVWWFLWWQRLLTQKQTHQAVTQLWRPFSLHTLPCCLTLCFIDFHLIFCASNVSDYFLTDASITDINNTLQSEKREDFVSLFLSFLSGLCRITFKNTVWNQLMCQSHSYHS